MKSDFLRRWKTATLFLLSVSLVGCKPKETVLSGQIFISTPLGNAKLGDAQIFLIEKAQAVEFLNKKQAILGAKITDCKREVESAQRELQQARDSYADFSVTKPYLTNSDYVRITSEREQFTQTIANLQQKCEPMKLQSDELRNAARSAINKRTPEFVYLEYRANSIFDPRWSTVQMRPHDAPASEPIQFKTWRSFLDTASRELSETTAQVRLLEQKKESSESQLSEIKRRAEASQQNTISAAEAHLNRANDAMSNYLAGIDTLVFEDFPAATALKTDSDADGKFTVTYPEGRAYTVFVKAEWKSESEKLTYYWLVDAPLVATSSLNLSNTKMIGADPDGYLKQLRNSLNKM